MKRVYWWSGIFLLIISIAVSCTKDFSAEKSVNLTTNAIGSLKDSFGVCGGIQAYGTYLQDTVLNNNNYLLVKVNITATGKYYIYSDTVNGYWFVDSGFAYYPGSQTLRVYGYGKPLLPKDAYFNLFFNGTSCMFIIEDKNYYGTGGTSNDYFPTAAGCSWLVYDWKEEDTLSKWVYRYDSTINGKVYRRFNQYHPIVPKLDTLFFRKDGVGNYYKFDKVEDYPVKYDYIFIKDNVPLGSQWDGPTIPTIYEGDSATLNYHYTIVAKNVGDTINGNIFADVIRVREAWLYTVFGKVKQDKVFEYTYAKNVGLVNINQTNILLPLTLQIASWKIY